MFCAIKTPSGKHRILELIEKKYIHINASFYNKNNASFIKKKLKNMGRKNA